MGVPGWVDLWNCFATGLLRLPWLLQMSCDWVAQIAMASANVLRLGCSDFCGFANFVCDWVAQIDMVSLIFFCDWVAQYASLSIYVVNGAAPASHATPK